MTCASCVAHVEHGLAETPGVTSATVNLANERATVTYDPGIAKVGDMLWHVQDVGYDVITDTLTLDLAQAPEDAGERAKSALAQLSGLVDVQVQGAQLSLKIIPGAVTLIPIFIIMKDLKWIDTILPLVIPGAANAFGFFFMRQYISTISDDIMDAARIDGASEFGIYWRIIVPIIAPGLTSLGLIFFMGAWNAILGPLIYLKTQSHFTLPLIIRSMTSTVGRTVYDNQMAASVISLIPLLIIFLVFQRRLMEGIAAGAVKG